MAHHEQQSSSSSSDGRSAALRCIEELLEQCITESQLLQAAGILTASQYCDVVDERNIEHICGYPLCDHQLGNVPRQKYRISTATNQVLDLTQRKKFCSSNCFKSSNFYHSQLSTFPPTSRAARRTVQLLSDYTLRGSEPKASEAISELVVKERTVSPLEDAKRDLSTFPIPVDLSQSPHSPSPSRNTPSPSRNTPSPSRNTPSPSRNTPSPSRNTPSPSQNSPSPSRNIPPHNTLPLSSMDSLCQSDKQPMPPDPPTHSVKTGSDRIFENKYIQQICDALVVWLSPVATNFDLSEGILHPPLHDMCVSQVQRSLFMSQIRSTLHSVGGGSGVADMASSFRLTNKCITFRPPQWKLIVLLLIALYHGEEAIERGILSHSLTELKATEEDFYTLLSKANQLTSSQTSDSSSDDDD